MPEYLPPSELAEIVSGFPPCVGPDTADRRWRPLPPRQPG